VNQISQESTKNTVFPRGGEQGTSPLAAIAGKQRGRLKRVAAGMGFGPADAEDIVQEVSLRAMQSGEYRGEKEALLWLMRVTVNECLAEHRRRKRFRKGALEILKRRRRKVSKGADERAIKAEELEKVREAMREMDGSLLSVMVLRYFCDMNSKQVGEALGLNPSTVRSRLREGRMILAGKLAAMGVKK